MTLPSPLSPEALEKALSALPGWTVQDGKLVREIATRNWKETLFVVNGIAALAEGENHHPDLHVFYRSVRIELWTHETGSLTERDLNLAQKVERWLQAVLD